MNKKEIMIQLAKEAYFEYLDMLEIREIAKIEDVFFAHNKYYSYMEMLTKTYPELSRPALEIEWDTKYER